MLKLGFYQNQTVYIFIESFSISIYYYNGYFWNYFVNLHISAIYGRIWRFYSVNDIYMWQIGAVIATCEVA